MTSIVFDYAAIAAALKGDNWYQAKRVETDTISQLTEEVIKAIPAPKAYREKVIRPFVASLPPAARQEYLYKLRMDLIRHMKTYRTINPLYVPLRDEGEL